MDAAYRAGRLRGHGLDYEEFTQGLACGGRAFTWKRRYLSLGGAEGGALVIRAPAGSYARLGGAGEFRYSSRTRAFRLDAPDLRLCVVRVLGTSPLELDCREFRTVLEGDSYSESSPEDELGRREADGGLCIDSCGWAGAVLIPAELDGKPVRRLSLGPDSLASGCRALIISEGIAEVSLDFANAKELTRLDFPGSARLVSSPTGIQQTNWFRRRPWGEPVYLGGWYCGTPGGGAGGEGVLKLREGTRGVAREADFHSWWRSISIPDSVEYIGGCAFASSCCLEELRLPRRCDMGKYAFIHAPRLNAKEKRGRIRAFPERGPITVCGRVYRDTSELCSGCEGWDVWGYPVRYFRLDDPNSPYSPERRSSWYIHLLSGERLELELPGWSSGGDRLGTRCLHLWYFAGPDGLAEVFNDPMLGIVLVTEGLSPGQIAEPLRSLLESDPPGAEPSPF